MAPIKKSTIFLGVAVLAGLVAAIKFFMPSKMDSDPAMTATETDATAPSKSETVATGSPSAEMKQAREIAVNTSYTTPAGQDPVSFTVFVDSNGVIVDAQSGILATNEISKKRQTAFAEGFAMAVKGKRLSELTAIDKVGGSSLTTKSFNDSLPRLKAGL